MRKKIWIWGVATGVLIGACAALFLYANRTSVTYHANKQVATRAHYKHFQKDGLYQEFFENGQPKLEVTYVNGVKTGKQTTFLPNGIRIETPFVNGQPSGTETYTTYDNNIVRTYNYTAGQKQGPATVSFPNGSEISLNYENNRPTGAFDFMGLPGNINNAGQFELKSLDGAQYIKGALTCDSDQFIDHLFNLKTRNQSDDLYQVMHCVQLEQLVLTYPNLLISFQGAFQYPDFSKETVLSFDLSKATFNQSQQTNNLLPSDGKISLKFDANNHLVTTGFTNSDGNELFSFTLESTQPIIKLLPDLTNGDLSEIRNSFLSAIKKNTSLLHLFVQDKTKQPVLRFDGKADLSSGFSLPSVLSAFDPKTGISWLNFATNEDTAKISIAYPLQNTPFMEAEIYMGPQSRKTYVDLMHQNPDLSAADTQQQIARILSEIAVHNLTFFNKDNQKIMALRFKTGNAVSLFTFLDNPLQSIDGEAVFYENNEENFRLTAQNGEVTLSKKDQSAQISQKTALLLLTAQFKQHESDTFMPFLDDVTKQISDIYPESNLNERYQANLLDYKANKVADVTVNYFLYLAVEHSEQSDKGSKIPDIYELGFATSPADLYGTTITCLTNKNGFSPENIRLQLKFTDTQLCNTTAHMLEVDTDCRDNAFIFQIR